MNCLNKIPLFRLLIPLLFGILTAINNCFRNENYIQFFDEKILFWDEEFVQPITPLLIDCVIVSGKLKLELENINCTKVIIDSSVPKYKWVQIKKECHKWDIPFYNVNTQGAYLFEFI